MSDLDLVDNKAIVERFLETFSSGNVPEIIGAMTPDATWWVSGKLNGLSGRYTTTQLGPLLEDANAGYKTKALRIVPSGMIAEADKVAVEATGRAELLGGQLYDCQYHFLFTVRDGKIAEVKEYLDTQHAKDIFFGS